MKYAANRVRDGAKLEAWSSGGSGMVFVSAAESASGAAFTGRKSGYAAFFLESLWPPFKVRPCMTRAVLALS